MLDGPTGGTRVGHSGLAPEAAAVLTRDDGARPRPVTGALTAKDVLQRSVGATVVQGEPAGAPNGVGRRPGEQKRKGHATPTSCRGADVVARWS